MQRSFSIITTCKGRLEHLQISLPRIVALGAAEVIVVDYSCPQGTGAYVREHFPQVQVISVEGQTYFSNWRARNIGAAAASGDLLIFCDADTILVDDALQRMADALPPRSFGFLKRDATSHLNSKGLRLGSNQLRGFHVVPAKAFRAVGGYDDVLEGYGAGGDTELESALVHIGVSSQPLDPAIIEQVIEHDNVERMKHHRVPISVSYCAGMMYRLAKRGLISVSGKRRLTSEMRKQLYDAAMGSAQRMASGRDTVALIAAADTRRVGMPLQLGFRRAVTRVSIKVEVVGEERVDQIPD